MEQVIRWLKVYLFFAMLTWAMLAIAGSSVLPALALFSSNQSISNNAFNTRNLVAPTNLTANPAGHDVRLNWSAGQNGNGYAILGVANLLSSSCPDPTTFTTTVGSSVSTSYTDTNHYTPQGNWYCYQVKTTYGNWTSTTSNPIAAAQIGFVATTVQMSNGGTAGVLDTNDQIVVNFNQAVNTTTGAPSGYVCSTNTIPYTLVLGTAKSAGACSATEAVSLGTLIGGSSNKNGRWAATWTWSNGNQTLTVTLGTRSAGGNPTISGTWTFNPTADQTKLLSSTGSFHICDNNSNGGYCLPITASQP
ncbi:MAG: hypothetical protein KGJ80_01965 [Chloroflexota bacterium]|nr:hypothetical protein [Chloroflexota bacterium]